MNPVLRRVLRRIGKPALELALPWAERFTGFRTARGDYLPSRLRMLTGRYEAEEFALMRQFLRPGQTVLDIGANVGYTTRFLARAVGPTGRVYAFEPNPLIFPLLKENLTRFEQVKTHNLGLASSAGEFPLFLAGNNHSVACFSEEYPATHLAYMENETMATVLAHVDRGDELLQREGVDHIDILKIDVEGWELNALAGLEQTIARSAGVAIFCEFNPAAQRCAGHEPQDLLHWFVDRQFVLSYLEGGRLESVSAGSIDQFTAQVAARSHSTLFATRK